MKNQQIKAKKRVQEFGEVYTAKKQVSDMLSLFPDKELMTTYLEPACGNGNFIEGILLRKILIARHVSLNHQEFMTNLLMVASTIYGMDIQFDNVLETRNRIKQIIENELGEKFLPCTYQKALDSIVRHNIFCGNTLNGVTYSGKKMKFYEWSLDSSFTLTGTAYSFEEMLTHNGVGTKPIGRLTYKLTDEEKELTA